MAVPFKSKKQMAYMFVNHPRVAQEMADAQKRSKGKRSFKNLPDRVKRKSGRKK